jgi:hypothetical protein
MLKYMPWSLNLASIDASITVLAIAIALIVLGRPFRISVERDGKESLDLWGSAEVTAGR